MPEIASDSAYIDASSLGWYNETLEMTLNIFADNSLTLTDGTDTASGDFEFNGVNITLSADGDTLAGCIDADGDIVFDELDGYFTFMGDFEGQQIVSTSGGDRAYADNGDGTMTYKVCAERYVYLPSAYITVAEDVIPDATAAADAVGGCFTVWDVTDWYYGCTDSDESFIYDYITGYAASDYSYFYGGTPNLVDFATVQVTNDKRIVTASANLYTQDNDIAVYCFIFSSTYANGDNRIITGTYFAAFEDTDEMNFCKKASHTLALAAGQPDEPIIKASVSEQAYVSWRGLRAFQAILLAVRPFF